jgi:hypothetical protein
VRAVILAAISAIFSAALFAYVSDSPQELNALLTMAVLFEVLRSRFGRNGGAE